jgi:RimJ/RimL family protein N-acetyltransferase
MIIPTVEKERLVLRGWREEDLDDYTAMVTDAEVMRFVAD